MAFPHAGSRYRRGGTPQSPPSALPVRPGRPHLPQATTEAASPWQPGSPNRFPRQPGSPDRRATHRPPTSRPPKPPRTTAPCKGGQSHAQAASDHPVTRSPAHRQHTIRSPPPADDSSSSGTRRLPSNSALSGTSHYRAPRTRWRQHPSRVCNSSSSGMRHRASGSTPSGTWHLLAATPIGHPSPGGDGNGVTVTARGGSGGPRRRVCWRLADVAEVWCAGWSSVVSLWADLAWGERLHAWSVRSPMPLTAPAAASGPGRGGTAGSIVAG